MTSTWAHLSCGQSGGVGVCPALLDSLAVGPTNTLCVVERISCLTRFTMGRKMEFWNKVRKLQVLDVKIRVAVGNPLGMVNRPLAGDVI